MDFSSEVYHLNESTGQFNIVVSATFDDCEQHKNVAVTEFGVKNIKSLMWCVNAVGYVELCWEDGKRICVLSGNGRWDLSNLNMYFRRKEGSKIHIRTSGFDELDSYTIIIAGQK